MRRLVAKFHRLKQRTYYLPVILPLVALALGVAVQRALSFDGAVILPTDFAFEPAAIAAAEATARYQAGALFVILFLTCPGVAGFGFAVTWRATPRRDRGWLVVEVLGIGAAALWMIGMIGRGGRLARHDLGDVLERTIGTYAPGNTMLEVLDGLVAASNAFAVVAAVVVVVGACRTGPPMIRRGHAQKIDELARDVAERTRRLKYLLFGGALVLVTGLFSMQAWRHWPAAFLQDATVRERYLAIADATIQYQSMLFVALLAATFLPAAMHLKAAGTKLADSMADADPTAAPARETWLKTRGLVLDPWERGQRILAVISPFLPAAIPTLIKPIENLPLG